MDIKQHPDFTKGFGCGVIEADRIVAGLTPEQLAVDEDGDVINDCAQRVVGSWALPMIDDPMTTEFICGFAEGMNSRGCTLDLNLGD
jgi:hypothetical protein